MSYLQPASRPHNSVTQGRWSGRSVMAVVLAVALVLTGLVMVRPQTASASEQAQFSRQHLRDVQRLYPDALVSDSQGVVRRLDGEDLPAMLDRGADRADPQTFADALAIMLTRAGQEVGISRPVPDKAGDEPAVSFPQASQTASPVVPDVGATSAPVPAPVIDSEGGDYIDGLFGASVIAGDLSGDGLDDVVRWSADGSAARLEAIRGKDGSTIWQVPVEVTERSSVALQAVGDVTGDGQADLLTSIQEFAAEPTESPCDTSGCEYREAFTWRIQLRDGTNGAVVWEQSYDGSLEFEDFYGGQDYGYSSRSVNAFVPFQPLQDVTGDGVGDFLVTLTTEEAFDSSITEGSYPGTVTETSTRGGTASTRVQILDGQDASLVEEFVQPQGPEVLSARPVPDTTGDGQNDVLVTRRNLETYTRVCVTEGTQRQCTEDGSRGGLSVSLHQAPSLMPEWTAEYPLGFGGASSPGDLTGDGVRDTVLDAFSTTGEGIIVVLDGTDGSEVWSEVSGTNVYGFGLLLVTPVQTDGALDLVSLVSRYDDADQSLDIVRRDGATGEVLLVTSTPVATAVEDNTFIYTSVVPAGDADGDGAEDLLLVSERQTPETFTVQTTVESGRTGQSLSTLPAQDGGQQYYQVAGDLDGDGGSDGVSFSSPFFYYQQEPPTPMVTAVRFRDGEVLWQQPTEPDSYVYGIQTAQFDGDAGDDLLINRERFTDVAYLQQVVAVDGEDGSVLWTAPPPPEVKRVAAAERIGTAVALSATAFSTSDAVVIARDDRFPDALAGGPLATSAGGPLLLTGSAALDPQTSAEIQRLGATRAVMLGGSAALGDQVVVDLQELGLQVERLAGADRFETAAIIADRVVAEGGPVDRVAVAAGGSGDSDQGWTDAILASAYGAGTGVPLVLVQADAVPQATAEVLQRLAPTQFLTLVGDGAAISADTETALQQLVGIDTIRLARDTAEATSVHVASFAIRDGASPAAVWVATADRFPDALAATAAVGSTGGILLLAGPAQQGNPDLLSLIGQMAPFIQTITVVGGPAAVAPETADAIAGSVSF